MPWRWPVSLGPPPLHSSVERLVPIFDCSVERLVLSLLADANRRANKACKTAAWLVWQEAGREERQRAKQAASGSEAEEEEESKKHKKRNKKKGKACKV